MIEPPTRRPPNNRLERSGGARVRWTIEFYALRLRPQLICDPFPLALRLELISTALQSQADSGLPTQRIPVAFRRVNHTFLYLYPRDT